MSGEELGKDVSLVYEPYGRFATERRFRGLTDNEVVFLIAGLTGVRYESVYRQEDLAELRDARAAQMDLYADQMVRALVEGLGWWRWLLPRRVQTRIAVMQMDFVRGTTKVWLDELVGMHAEVARSRRPQPVRARKAEPLVPCRCCGTTFPRSDFLPEGWTADDDGFPRCPRHRVISLEKKEKTA